MVLSLTCSPSLQESMANLADNISKLEVVMAKFLANSFSTVSHFDNISKHLPVTANNFTSQYEQMSSFITTMTKTEPHNTKVLPLFPPPPSLQIRQYTSLPTFCLAKLTESKSIDELSPSNSSPLIHESTTNTKNPTSDTKTDISKTTTKVVTEIHVSPLSDFPANPTRKTPKLRHDIAIFPQTTIHATYGVATFIADNLTIFRRQETFPHGHQCPPPKFIFLQTDPEPPWKLRRTWYKDMSLEDKARFQALGIDT